MRRVISVVCWCALSAAFVSAGTTYTVDAAVECAMANNISIEQSRLSLDALKRKKGVSWNGILPSLSAGAGGSKTLTEPKTATGTKMPNQAATETNPVSAYTSLGANLSVSATLFTAVRGAQLDYEAGLISRESASRTVELSVRKIFYGILCDQANVEVLTATLETARKNRDQTLANRKVGLASELDSLTAEVSVEDLQLSLLSAQNALANDLSSFKNMLGIGEDEEISLEGSPEDALPVAQIDVSGISGKSIEVASAEKALETAKLAAIRSMAQEWSPVFSLSMNYRYSTSDIDKGDWTDNATMTAAVTVPLDGLIPWSASNSSRNSASETVRDRELQLASVSSSANLKTQTLQRKIRQSLTTLDARDLSVNLAEKSYAMTEQAYRSGTKDMLALQTSSDALLKAKLLRMQEVYSLVSSILDLENALGVPFGTLGR